MTREYQHITADGKAVRLKNMSDSHLLNTIALHRRKAAEGFIVRRGGISIADDEPWYDEEELHGTEALSVLNHDLYLAEAKRRKLEV